MRRWLIALLVAGCMFAAVYGLAASLGVSSNTLGAGNAIVVACQSGTVNVSYGPSYSAVATAGYRATTVTLENLDTSAGACGGKSYRITLTGPGASSASLGEQTGTIPTSGTTATATFSGVNASDVTGVHVAITG